MDEFKKEEINENIEQIDSVDEVENYAQSEEFIEEDLIETSDSEKQKKSCA